MNPTAYAVANNVAAGTYLVCNPFNQVMFARAAIFSFSAITYRVNADRSITRVC